MAARASYPSPSVTSPGDTLASPAFFELSMDMEDGNIASFERGVFWCKRMATLKGDSMARQLTRDAQVLDSKSADNIKVRRNHIALAMDSLVGCKRITLGRTLQGRGDVCGRKRSLIPTPLLVISLTDADSCTLSPVEKIRTVSSFNKDVRWPPYS
jgi:hypothetical protein